MYEQQKYSPESCLFTVTIDIEKNGMFGKQIGLSGEPKRV